ncbi:MAG: PQQ-dependent sugar dehydrogenase [Anaerolineales bacterium]|nr:PQQ-dependent sugar dehydrogenase [Anaerolineales bacterium]
MQQRLSPIRSCKVLAYAACLLVLAAASAALLSPRSSVQAQSGISLALVPLITGGLNDPVFVTHAGDSRLFIVERCGRIRIFKNNALLATPFLDISNTGANRVRCWGGEEGLLSVAFAPDYATNGRFYVYYVNVAGDLVIARYHVSTNPDVADVNSEQIVLTIPHPIHNNHNGGQLAFGPNDGLLYIGPGDGGSGGDPPNNAQNPAQLLGKLLRINVEAGNPVTYTIPTTNPFTQTSGYRGEIWALGLRNPWRFSFDRATGDLFIADVGQYAWEEVNYQPANSNGGQNYGWRCFEGNADYNTSGCGPRGNYTFPVSAYGRDQGCSVTGGYVYRGALYPNLTGRYLYSDFCSGRIWSLRFTGAAWENVELLNSGLSISSFGEDVNGELYVAGYSNDTIYRLVDNAATPIRLFLPLIVR